jgi:SAM-dependent methyltransferase
MIGFGARAKSRFACAAALNCDGFLRHDRGMSGEPSTGGEWLATPLGRRCLANEQRLMRQALERVFGEQCLQIGEWGARNTFLRFARTQRRALLDWRPGVQADIVSHAEQLAVATDSVDVVLLPHTLERTASPHALLREVDRVLRADGHLIVLSFAPGGFWGLRHLLSSRGFPAGRERLIREGRLRDWLELLSFDVPAATRYCHTLPIERFSQLKILPREEWAQRWLPFVSGGYLVRAQKRVMPLTPVRLWRRQPRLRVVGGLVEPTTRTPVRLVPPPPAERPERS